MVDMVSASLLIQARRTAGLSQRALAARAGVSQQEVARYERGRVTPSLERLRALVAACGLELTFGLAREDDSYDEPIAAALALAPAARLRHGLADAQPLRAARAAAAGASVPPAADVLGVLRALAGSGVQFVLIGELAETLRGSPLLPVTGTVTIVARAGQQASIGAVITATGGHPSDSSPSAGLDAPVSFALERYAADLIIAPAPPGTHGYEDLRRDATAITLDEVTVEVASLVDLVRIAEASGDQARLPALRRALELADTLALANADAA